MDARRNVYMDESARIPAEDRERYEKALAEAQHDEAAAAKLRAAEARARIAWENTGRGRR